ncbi:MAG TPA: PadR family transcriptional regulator [Clostridia bacterium]|jgi:PadR family transcriptional regulator PadR|nr:MAG: Transcriptional regulator PadR-like family protein [Firmicutes bacterium ADurb.Bin248]HOG01629.1 PadR family transcriptional regulator [Clostridia bacterium]HOS19562.1 PadR family transcriptional regulator [Clostridia bacterium]HPK15995.1 PadR family transcriptional regulator [Clostridia bacterium]
MTFQLGSALLDACVLAVLDREDTYGYVLTQSVKQVVEISESTLYPVLRRLQKDDMLSTYDQPYSGRLRRYYAITPGGREKLSEYRGAWRAYRESVEKILFGGNGI